MHTEYISTFFKKIISKKWKTWTIGKYLTDRHVNKYIQAGAGGQVQLCGNWDVWV
jgi:hypothetical protein